MAKGGGHLRRFRFALRRLCREGMAYALLASGRRNSSLKVLIFAQGRTGSTLLESLLESTGHFDSHGEVLKSHNIKVRRPGAFVRGLALRRPSRSFICHVKIYHLTDLRRQASVPEVDPAGFLAELAADGWRLIYLRRENHARQVLSNLVARARGKYHKRDDRPETTRITVSREELEHGVERRRRLTREESRALAGRDYLEVVYERDLENSAGHQATVDRILTWLGLELRPVRTEMRKINTRTVPEIVVNHEEFTGWVREMGLEL